MTGTKRLLLAGLAAFSLVQLAGCIALAPLAGSEAVTNRASRHQGKILRQGVDVSLPSPKHLNIKVFLDREDWTCYPGVGMYLGKELCLPPEQATAFETEKYDRSWFECHEGRGGIITRVGLNDFTYYCALEGSPS